MRVSDCVPDTWIELECCILLDSQTIKFSSESVIFSLEHQDNSHKSLIIKRLQLFPRELRWLRQFVQGVCGLFTDDLFGTHEVFRG